MNYRESGNSSGKKFRRTTETKLKKREVSDGDDDDGDTTEENVCIGI